MLEVTEQFIQENKLVKPSQKFSQYTRQDRIKRRNEVFRLHFEHSLTASRIAELMKINRNTINSDIRFWYSRISLEYTINPEERIFESLTRLKLQRQRLREKLDKNLTISEQITIERLLFDIESRIVSIEIKLTESMVSLNERAVNLANQKLKQHGKDFKVASIFDMVKCSHSTNQKIIKLIKEDKKSRGVLQ